MYLILENIDVLDYRVAANLLRKCWRHYCRTMLDLIYDSSLSKELLKKISSDASTKILVVLAEKSIDAFHYSRIEN